MSIKHLPLNTLITGIGRLFKYEGSPWRINLWGESSTRYNTLFSNMNLLAKRRIINSTSSEHRKLGYRLTFTCPSPQAWQFFAQRKPQTHFCGFDAQTTFANEEQTIKQVHIELPQLELARALFFHNAYLTCSALELNVLEEDFDIQDKKDHYLINVLPSCSLALSHLNKPGFRRILAYLLLNHQMKASFESIAQHRQGYENITETVKTWNFYFTPPNLEGVNIEAHGYYDKLANTFRVDEIIGFSGLLTHIEKQVFYFHENFSHAKQSSGKTSVIPPAPNHAEPKLNDDEDAQPSNDPVIVDGPTTLFDFSDPFETKKVADQTGTKSSVIVDDSQEYVDELIGDVNSGESGIGGTVKAGDFNGARDQTVDAHLYLDRFSAFMQMLYKLEEKYAIQCSLTLKVLPEVEGFSKHLKVDGSPRCIAEVHFIHQGKHFILLEVDTSDDAKRLSTQLLVLHNINNWEEDYEKIRKYIVQKTLNWPNHFIKKIATKQTRFNHPRFEEQGQQVAIEDFDGWATRIYNSLKC